MNIACKLGLHKWIGCKCYSCAKTRAEGHDWSKDCEVCSRCGKTRDGAHDWSKDCNTCARCQKTRDVAHDWSKDCAKCGKCGATRQANHKWDGCKCRVCGKTRREGHDWEENCERCRKCGAKRSNVHQWDGCRCRTCGATRNSDHDFEGLKCRKCGEQLRHLSLSPTQPCLILNFPDEGIRDLSFLRMSTKIGDLMLHMERRNTHYDYWIVIGNCKTEITLKTLAKAGCGGFSDSKQVPYRAVLVDSEECN